jgi:hypothetical protein
MNKSNTASTEDLIKKANAALKGGDSHSAWEYALAATKQDPQSEQAWLILASLSEPEQALLYVENALRANPESKSAHKAVRLVYSQMQVKENETIKEKSERLLSDTAPIPVSRNKKMIFKAPVAEEQATSGSKEIEAAPHPSHSRKEMLLNRLRKNTASVSQISQETIAPDLEILQIDEKAETIAAEPEVEKAAAPEHEQLQVSAPSISAEEPVVPEHIERTEAAPEPEQPPISEPFLSVEEPASPEQIERTEAAAEPEAEPLAEEPAEAEASITIEPVTEEPATEGLKKEETLKAMDEAAPVSIESLPKAKRNRRKPVVPPAAIPDQVEISLNHAAPTGNNQEPADIDTIELILVSVSAILLPLLVFLYFYLTR